MSRKIGAVLVSLLTLTFAAAILLRVLTGGKAAAPAQEHKLTVVAATYPIYLFTCALTEDVDNITVERLDTGSVSCLHDYTLSMRDMQKIESADLIAVNGAGLEEFLEHALETSDAQIVDCSQGIALLESLSHDHDGHDGHDHGHWDPHYWMDPERAAQMVQNLQAGLAQLDPDHAQQYMENSAIIAALLASRQSLAEELIQLYHPISGLITFHDGFQYFAAAYGLPLLASIEEEAGSEASAKEIVEITELVQKYELPVIFTEANGSDATAQAIARETGCRVVQLSMVMDGPDGSLEHYLNAVTDNVIAVVNGFAGEELIRHEGEN